MKQGGREIDYFVMQTGNVYRQISCVAKQLLPFGLLECDSGSLFNCDLHLKYGNYIHIPLITCVLIPTAVGGASCINLPSNFHLMLLSSCIIYVCNKTYYPLI